MLIDSIADEIKDIDFPQRNALKRTYFFFQTLPSYLHTCIYKKFRPHKF